MIEIIKENILIFAAMGGCIVLSFVMFIIQSKNRKNKSEKFLKENPTAGRVFLTNKALITTEAVSVHLVNNAAPIFFNEKGKVGIYVKEGESNIQISYTYSRLGIMYKNVTETYGPVEKEITIEPKKDYFLSFDRKKEEFVFEEK